MEQMKWCIVSITFQVNMKIHFECWLGECSICHFTSTRYDNISQISMVIVMPIDWWLVTADIYTARCHHPLVTNLWTIHWTQHKSMVVLSMKSSAFPNTWTLSGTDKASISCDFDNSFSCGYSDFSRTGVHWVRMGKNERKLESLSGLKSGELLWVTV